jgi:hypothetical protein
MGEIEFEKIECPECKSEKCVRNGHGSKRKKDGVRPKVLLCLQCGRTYTHPEDRLMSRYRNQERILTCEDVHKVKSRKHYERNKIKISKKGKERWLELKNDPERYNIYLIKNRNSRRKLRAKRLLEKEKIIEI